MSRLMPVGPVPVTDQPAYVRRALARVIAASPRPIEEPRLRITPYARAGAPPIVVVQVNAAIDGRLLRAQVAASTTLDALDRAIDGLGRHIDRLCRHLTAAERGATSFTADEWNTAPLPAPTGLIGSGSGPRRLVRRKVCRLAVQSTDAAAFTMDLRDYRFHLLIDETGQPCLVFRGGPSGYRLIGGAAAARPVHGTAPLTVQAEAARSLTPAQAIAALDATSARYFLFHLEPEHRYGRVLYRRYDGHLGLLEGRPA